MTAFAAGAATGRPRAEPRPKLPLPPLVLPSHRHPWCLLRSPHALVAPPRDKPPNAIATLDVGATRVAAPLPSPPFQSSYEANSDFPSSSPRVRARARAPRPCPLQLASELDAARHQRRRPCFCGGPSSSLPRAKSSRPRASPTPCEAHRPSPAAFPSSEL